MMASRRPERWAIGSYRRLLRLARGMGPQDTTEVERDARQLLRAATAAGSAAVVRTWMLLVWDVFASGVRHDVAQAVRTLRRAPGFTITMGLVLGLGLAATTTLFALVDAVLLRPLPYDSPERLVAVWETNVSQDRVREGPSPGNLVDWSARNDAFEHLSGWMTTSMTLRGRDGAAPVTGVQVTRGFFEVFGTRAAIGRTFAADEYDRAAWNIANRFVGREPIIVLSHGLWRSLGSDPSLVGRTLSVEGREWLVVGVMPPEFAIPDAHVAFWTPWDLSSSYTGARFPSGPPRDFRFLRVIGRLRATVTLEAAHARMAAVAEGLAREHPAVNAGWGIRLVPLAEETMSGSRAELIAIFGAVFCLLLLVCANVSSLTVARAAARRRELAIRMALGAGRSRIVRQLVSESLLLVLTATGAALLLTAWWLDAVVALSPAGIPRLHEVAMNARVVGFAAALALLVTAVAGIVPAIHGSTGSIARALTDGVPTTGGRSGHLRRTLVTAELAAALMLLVGAGLLGRSFVALNQVNPGFDTRNLLVMRITPDAARYRTGAQAADYYRRVLDSVRTIPAVASVAAVTVLPLSTVGVDFDRPYWREGPRPPGDALPEADIRMATPGYFGTIGLQLVGGREFSDRDTTDAPPVVIVNESLARRHWPGENAVGHRLILDYQRGAYPYEIVGVVRDARYYGPRSEPRPEIFIPHAQNPYLVMNVVARTTIEPEAVAQTARTRALQVDAHQPVHSMTTMATLVGDSVAKDRFAALLLSAFAVAGVIVATTGVYALLAYTVTQRRREIAVRLAVGATPRTVARLVMGESLLLCAVGGAIGLAGALAGGRIAQSLLFGITAHDPLTLGGTGVLLVLVVLAASWIPMRRATRIDPVAAMKL
jgi:putative ABC transport system permease protein